MHTGCVRVAYERCVDLCARTALRWVHQVPTALGLELHGRPPLMISPLIDLLVISGSGFLTIGSILKVISVATRYQPHILGLSSLDFLLMCGVCWGATLVLAARTWVQLNEPELLRQREERLRREESWQVEELDYDESEAGDEATKAAAGER